ncbi:Glycosyl hydrolases family 32, Beta-fructosidase or sucrose-6-phosphate hydrolase [Bifidobacterium actinocoloniiforme DSM 22766]|uniref:beta-fructofuranosidase n=1 Tax=Bifidobacterium actinocoloniiforme DSM 22766 TaxID=1437605 RepID=A0A086YYB2_9BIFI|nr:glycoside hydrolase family 32 protein [Bifidobacterium actinocoloniiforme]AKV55827.1 glycosyl hydrolase family 32 [Bifidobacterium actinocoloniiforme DSM 22766]KFI39262.1 Glycosyl hydrolases family 32, Beta-fructosidase or sucrose-6-phosphate hydrolase [Bifidobacterium actinocoloniiforme DSM 22766]
MSKLYYQYLGTWFGDCMPFGSGDEFFLFHQRDTRRPGPFGEPFGWSLATTKDFVHYKDCGTAIERGGDEDQDQFIYAGSVFEAEGRYHAFYTGYNRDYPAQGKASQVLMHAVSDDLYSWTKTKDALTFTPQEGYDQDDWRDPWVIRDDARGLYLLILGARLQGPKTQQTGRTVKFSSPDLEHWTFEGDFWAPDLYTMHEMPDLFKMGDWWYHIVTEYSDKHGMVYRMARSLDGPWTAPTDDAFDGSAYYAGRTFELGGKRVLFGWVGTKEKNDDRRNYEWAGTFVPHQVYQRPDGSLGVKPVDTLWESFAQFRPIDDLRLKSTDGRRKRVLASDCGDLFSFDAHVKFEEGTRSFGFRIYGDEGTGQSYQYIFKVRENRYLFEGSPNYPWFTNMNIGLERPIELAPDRDYHIQLIVDDSIATLYVNGVALNARAYKHYGDDLSVFVTDGAVELSGMSISRSLKEE